MASIRKRTWTNKGVEQTAWVLDYRDSGGKRRLKTFATKKAAEAWSVTALHEVAQGIHTAASVSITVSEGMRRWIEDGEANGLEFGTVRGRSIIKKLHIDPFIGADKLSALTVPRLHEFDAKLRDGGRSLDLRRKALSHLKTMLTFCQNKGFVAHNVALAVKLKNDDRRDDAPLRAGVDFPNLAELRIIATRKNEWERWYPLLVTAAFTGMRASELRGLAWSEVDLDGATIFVRQRADQWGVIGKPKSKAANRDIPLTPLVVNTLGQWKEECPSGEFNLTFPNGVGNVQSHQNILHRFWEPFQIANGMGANSDQTDGQGQPIQRAKYGLHALRHVAASLFIAHLGWTPKKLQVVMGHSSIQMTFDLYGHLFEDQTADREAMRKLEAAVVVAA